MKTFTLNIDGRRYEVDAEGKNLLHVCLSLGLNLPYFCWHPALHSVGACRQCAVKLFKDEADTKGRIVMSCMTPVTDGMRVSVEDPEARMFRGQVTEWLMVNHPHDCPICDEGGECHLQDMIGHDRPRLPPLPLHQAHAQQPGPRAVHQPRDEPLHPVLPLHPLLPRLRGRHGPGGAGRARRRVLRPADRRGPGERVQRQPRGGLPHRRVHRQDAEVALHAQVGPADRAVASACTAPWAATRSPASATARSAACAPATTARSTATSSATAAATATSSSTAPGGSASPWCAAKVPSSRPPRRTPSSTAANALSAGGAIGIGSTRASLETNYALRSLVGAANFYLGVSDRHFEILRLMARVLKEGPAPTASVRQVAASDAVSILGEDVWNTAPILALNLRQASTNAPAAAAMKQKKLNAWDDAARPRGHPAREGAVLHRHRGSRRSWTRWRASATG